jgi:adenine deaminase
VFDLITGELVETDVAICGDTIVGVFGAYEGRRVVDVAGRVLVPGFIDTHLHIESSLVTPFEFDRCVCPRGVTTAICDPHEIANVCGLEGIGYFLDASARTLMDIRVQLSSCVPSTHMETAGARLEAADLIPLMDHPRGIGLAEFMNFPGVLMQDAGCMAKLAAWQGRHIDGHAPLLRGNDLNAYIAAGIGTEHEATSAEEALEKLRKGMRVLIREGSVSKDLHALAPLLVERYAPYLCLCTDDRNPLDIAEHGHLDHMIRTAIALGSASPKIITTNANAATAPNSTNGGWSRTRSYSSAVMQMRASVLRRNNATLKRYASLMRDCTMLAREACCNALSCRREMTDNDASAAAANATPTKAIRIPSQWNGTDKRATAILPTRRSF